MTFIDEFETLPIGLNWADGTNHGQWHDNYGGFGKVGIIRDGSHVLSLCPKTAIQSNETHACLVTSLPSFGNFDVSLDLKTVRQLRAIPNPWEVAWFIWHHTDDNHFYYLALKPDGWELGKEDPAYPGSQRFLLTGSTPTFNIGSWYTIRVKQTGNVIKVWANGKSLGSFTDIERPYLIGGFGLYCEDAEVLFDNVKG